MTESQGPMADRPTASTASAAAVPEPAWAQEIIDDLTRLVAVPSIGAQAEHADDLARSASLVAELLSQAGCPEVQVLDDCSAPAVLGRYPAPPGAPTVCLYAHHDVQPVDLADWRTPPFQLTRVGERLYGRGAADDKGGLAAHLACLRRLGPNPPVGLTVFIEGEEEVGSPHVDQFLARYREQLRADVYVIADADNWDVGYPALTTSLRGVCLALVEVATLDHAVHSGQFGGVLPDALTTLCHLLASLHAPDGSVAVAGLEARTSFAVDYPDDRFRTEAGLLPGVAYLGQGSLADRLWAGPAITVIALDAPSLEQASNTLLPRARALVSLRVPPGLKADQALAQLTDHLQTHAPWGAQVQVTPAAAGDPAQIAVDGPFAQTALAAWGEAFGQTPALIGQGGSIPLVNQLSSVYPEASLIVSAVGDPDSRMHGANESVHFGDLIRSVEAEVAFIRRLGDAAQG
ncbi:MAG: M20/M25/M40 family metallo-hydrolase [Propionibacteriaceae bacterium]|nr:M20/M25/M40 family metallo-hydrolase [Propionibacteriaceae bacterium]